MMLTVTVMPGTRRSRTYKSKLIIRRGGGRSQPRMLLQMQCSALALLLLLNTLVTDACLRSGKVNEFESVPHDACCSFPCQHRGMCISHGARVAPTYTCDCANTGYYGDNCQIPYWSTYLRTMLKPSPETMHSLLMGYSWLWAVINRVDTVREFLMRRIYLVRAEPVDSPSHLSTGYDYISIDNYLNQSYYARSLPPVPHNCPRPMGLVGPKQLPDSGAMAAKLFTRRHFIPEDTGSNVLFAFFAQHFTHQFFKTRIDVGHGEFTWSDHGVHVSHVYGETLERRLALRSMVNGKLKSQVINGEEWPPSVADTGVYMNYPPNVPKSRQFAIGQRVNAMLPGLFMWSTVWLREHNRVCDLLLREHPHWGDEQLYQTARLIILGETINVVITDYVQHLSGYHFKLTFQPELLYGDSYQYQNRIHTEFNHLYHWHPLMPDEFNISDKVVPLKDALFNTELVTKRGLSGFIQDMVKQTAGRVGPFNHSPLTIGVAKETIDHGRALRLQPFNEYRKRFNMKPYDTFEELTGDADTAKLLEQLYGEVDAVEFFVGVLLERHWPGAMFGSTVIEMGGPYSVRGLLANPICSPSWWRPATFGGDVGFRLVRTTRLRDLVCRNLGRSSGEGCPEVRFSVEPEALADAMETYESQRQSEL